MLSCRPPSVPLPLPQRGHPSPPAPLPPCGRGVIWCANAVSLPAAGSPLLRSSLPLPLPQRESGRGLGGKVRAALTPGPSPALRERGDLGRKRGIVASRRIAPAPLISPPSAPAAWERKGARGKVRAALTPGPSPALRERGDLVRKRGIVASRRIAPAPLLPPLPLPLGESGRGPGGKVRAALTPSPFPALRERGDLVRKRGIVASRRIAPAPLISPPSAPAAWERKGAGGEGEGRPHPQPLSRPAGEG
jgi:hypothetical protein